MKLNIFHKFLTNCFFLYHWNRAYKRNVFRKNNISGRENEMNENTPRSRKPLTEEERRRRARLIKKKKREAQVRKLRIICSISALVVVVVVILAITAALKAHNQSKGSAEPNQSVSSKEQSPMPETSEQPSSEPSTEKQEPQTTPETTTSSSADEDLIAKADVLAASYDYDAAMDLLKTSDNYGTNAKLQRKVAEYQATKDTCVAYPIDQITHVFYHTLIKDPSRAFDGESDSGGYNQVMTTIDEFNKITQSMYEKGFVMVRLEDIASVNEQGIMTANEIMLPPGKKAFVLSQDDVSYYHYMDGDGMASKLVIDESGDVKAEYVETDGSVTVGDFDMVPLIDRFVEQHPDFSYRGAKGIVALTGYNGVLGYRTDGVYRDINDPNLDPDQIEFLNNHPDFNWDEEVAQATKVADAMKKNGWAFASHTWGHLNVGYRDLDSLKKDTEKWLTYVKPIVGECDKIIFAFGTDITGVEDYTGHPKFEFLKSKGFNYFCNVDSHQYWIQLRDNYFRMGRRNLDGYRMYYNPELLSDLFDASQVFDPARPTPVPPMS